MTEIKSIKTKKAAFVINYMASRSFGVYGTGEYPSPHFSGTTTYDDDLDFVAEFEIAFPPRKNDGNHTHASINLRRLMKEMVEDGYMDRGRLGNEKYVPQEPSWQYVYNLKQWVIREIREGKKTAEQIAIEWNGL